MARLRGLGPGEPVAFGPGRRLRPCACTAAEGTVVGPGLGTPAFRSGTCALGTVRAKSAAGFAGAALGAGGAGGAGVAGSFVGAALGAALGPAVGGTLIATATACAVGTEIGTAGIVGSTTGAATCCVGIGLGSAEATGAGVGLGGAVGANFVSSCSTGGWWAEACRGRARGGAVASAWGTGGAACRTGTGRLGTSARLLTVTISFPITDSGDACSDDELSVEITKRAMSACKTSEAR